MELIVFQADAGYETGSSKLTGALDMEKNTKIAIDGNSSEGSQTKLQWTTPKLNSEKISNTQNGAGIGPAAGDGVNSLS